MSTFPAAISAPAYGSTIAMDITDPVAAKVIATGIRGADNTGTQKRAKRATSDWTPTSTPARSASATAGSTPERVGVTVRFGDTLWGIAEKNDMPGVTRYQEMMAIFYANPDAFINGDINRIKAGARLVLPSAATALATDALRARQLFTEHVNNSIEKQERRTTREAPSIRAEDNTASPKGAQRETSEWGLFATSSTADSLSKSPVITVHSGDSLWKISERYEMPGATRNQEMMAIFYANPDAFIDGNINQLKAGARLILPNAATVLAIDATRARELFTEQINKPYPPAQANQSCLQEAASTTHQVPCSKRPSSGAWQAGDEVITNYGQTLTEIADQYHVPNMQLTQKMVAIFNGNPRAFINNDMNLMKAGARLVLPSLKDIEAIPRLEAHRIVTEQIEKYNRRQA